MYVCNVCVYVKGSVWRLLCLFKFINDGKQPLWIIGGGKYII